jgi:hypothetical protein
MQLKNAMFSLHFIKKFQRGYFRHPLSLFPVRIPDGKRLRPFFSKMASASRSRGWTEAPHRDEIIDGGVSWLNH